MENKEQTHNDIEKADTNNTPHILNLDKIFRNNGSLRWDFYERRFNNDEFSNAIRDANGDNIDIEGIEIITSLPLQTTPIYTPAYARRDINTFSYIFPQDFTQNSENYPDAIKNMGYKDIDDWETYPYRKRNSEERDEEIKRQLAKIIDPNIFKRALIEKIQKLSDDSIMDNLKYIHNFLIDDVKYNETTNTPTFFWKDENGMSIKQALDDYDKKNDNEINYSFKELLKYENCPNYTIKAYEKIFGTTQLYTLFESKGKLEKLEKTSKTFEQQIKEVKAGTYNRYNALKVCDTPQILLDVGCEQLPMLYTQKHLKNALENTKNLHTHNLDEEAIKMMPKLLKDPAMIFDSLTRNDSLIVMTDKIDKENKPIIICVKPNGKGIYELETINANFITSIYGKKSFTSFIEKTINENKMLYWNKEKSQDLFSMLRLRLPQGLNNLDSDAILHKSSTIVKQKPKKLSETLNNFITSIKKLHTIEPTLLFTKSQEALKQMPQKEKDKFNAICKKHGIDTQDKLVDFLAKISTTDFDVRKTKKPTQTKDKSKDNDRSR